MSTNNYNQFIAISLLMFSISYVYADSLTITKLFTVAENKQNIDIPFCVYKVSLLQYQVKMSCGVKAKVSLHSITSKAHSEITTSPIKHRWGFDTTEFKSQRQKESTSGWYTL